MKRRPAFRQPSLDFSKPLEPQATPQEPPEPPPRIVSEQPKPNGTSHVARLKAKRGQLTLFDFAKDEPEAEPPPDAIVEPAPPPVALPPVQPHFSSGEKAKAKDILAAIRTLKQVEHENRPATQDERQALARFCGFGPVALHIFPDPITGKYKDGWQQTGEELRDLLTIEEYDSAKRTTFNAFYTSPTVIQAMHSALQRLGVPDSAVVLEPGAGIGNFLAYAPTDQRYIGVELDSLSGRISRLLHPQADIRIENFRDTKLPPLDAVIGNVPFADVKLDWKGQRFSLHDFFIAKSVDALKPGGILAVVTSHFTLDRQNAVVRETLAEQADFLGAIRLPSDAFKQQGTAVVTDIVFLRKRAKGQEPNHADPDWLKVGSLTLDGDLSKGNGESLPCEVAVNRYFLNHPEMVLGTWSRKDTLYGEGYSVTGNGDLAEQLREAVGRLQESKSSGKDGSPEKSQKPSLTESKPTFTPPPLLKHIAEGSFFVHDSRVHQMVNGQAEPVVYGGSQLWAGGALTGRRMGHLIELRDHARRVLQSQNEDWPEEHRKEARRQLNWSYDRFTSAYGPINKTTFGETKDGTTIRRMPNLVKFREDPDAMLVMSLEEYDEATGKAEKSAIMKKDVVGKTPPVTHVTSAEEGLLVSLNQRGQIDLPFIAGLYGKPEAEIISELGTLIYLDPESKSWETADAYLSGNVRAKHVAAEKAGPEFARNVEALSKVQPEDVLPGDIDCNLGSPWVPEADVQQFAAELFGVQPSSIPVAHLKKDAVWTVSPDYAAQNSVPATVDYGTSRINGITLFEHALNMKSPVIYDPDPMDDKRRIVNPTETLAAKEKQKLIKEKFRAWVFTDPERCERLVRIYNDNFNNLRPRLFDGSHLTFPGKNPTIELRPHQTAAVWRCMTAGNTLLAHTVGAGKAQPLDAKVLTPNGWSRMGNLRHGDEVIAGDGTVTTVTGVFPQGMKAIWRVAFSDGSSTECCDDHLWLTQTYAERTSEQNGRRLGKVWPCAQPRVRSTAAIRNTLADPRLGTKNHSIPMVGPVQLAAQPVPLDPYLVGVLLGDGSLSGTGATLCNPDDEILTHLTLPENIELRDNTGGSRCKTWGFRMVKQRGFGAERGPNPLVARLAELGLMGTKSESKFIPACYKFNAPDVRLAILQGLLDTDGYVQKNGTSTYYYTVSQRLADDVTFLVQSLGGLVRRRIKERPAYTYRGERRVGKPCFNLCISMPPEINPFRLSRKAVLVRPKSSYAPRRFVIAVEPVGPKEAQCIAVAHPSRLYVTDDMIVTHNTYEMAAAAMKMRQAGIAKKPLICLPNHLLEQFGREFMHLYPNAKLLIAGKEDFTKERRKLLTAKIASGDWDAILMTHSSFERIGMSRDYQEKFLREQIEEYEHLILENASRKNTGNGRNIIKSLEKQKANREEKLKDLIAKDKKDDGLTFDLLGVDQLFIDEFQAFKNLEAASKMDRVAGIATGGSERAFDIYMKARYLDEQHAGHGLVGASGTPISNSMVEMYTQQRYFDPAGLQSRGIEHFDAWAGQFGEVVDAMEISPDGKSLRPRSRFARFVNLPELQQMFRAFADVQTAEMLNLPRPALVGGKPQTIACPMSDEQKAIQMELVERYEKLRSSKVDPRVDNALNITTDGRKLALDARMLDAAAPDHPHSKVNALVENVARIWKETAPTKGTQMIFCDMGVHPTAWGFSAYEEITRKLTAAGIPAAQIAAVGDADTDAKKQVLFEKVRQGSVRILLGSTQKMGTGTNVQKRLVALHHLDAPWKPAEVEQRDGRILRQGNENKEVSIFRYVTEGSFDAYMWQALETKARFIAQVITGDNTARKAEDICGQELSYAEVKAIASGNPAVLTLAESDAELKRLSILKKNSADEQYLARKSIRDLPGTIRNRAERVKHLTADRDTLEANASAPLIIGGRAVDWDDAVDVLRKRIDALPQMVSETRPVTLGKFRGLNFGLVLYQHFSPEIFLDGEGYRQDRLPRDSGPRAILNALGRLADSYRIACDYAQEELTVAKGQLTDYQARIGKPFEHEQYYAELTKLRDGLRDGLAGMTEEGGPSVGELSEKIKALRAANAVEAAPQRTAARKVSAEEPVTSRIRRQMAEETPMTTVEVNGVTKHNEAKERIA